MIASDLDACVARLANDRAWRAEPRTKSCDCKHRLQEDDSVLAAFSEYQQSAARRP